MKRIITITYALVCTLCLSAQILVIPDVHGRTFWKEAVEKHPTLPVVFLGDYLDPYARENITPEEALANFKDIIAFKQANKDRVTLLIGNHEIHYFDTFYKFSRKDTLNSEYIHQLLLDNLPLFSIASQAEMNGKTFLFTHAGIVESWWKKYFPNTSMDAMSVCNALNAKMSNKETLGAVIKKTFADLDCRKAFLITPSGKIIEDKR